jgi:hypothetical protein
MTKTWWEAPMGVSVLSFLKAEWKVSDTGSAHWASSFIVLAHWKKQSADRHVASLGHIILIPSQPVFALSPVCSALCDEAINTNFIVWFDLTGAQTYDLPHSRRAS